VLAAKNCIYKKNEGLFINIFGADKKNNNFFRHFLEIFWEIFSPEILFGIEVFFLGGIFFIGGDATILLLDRHVKWNFASVLA
jgi:hypothetical protein